NGASPSRLLGLPGNADRLRACIPFDLGGVEAEAEVGRFASRAGPSVESDDAGGIHRPAYVLVPRALDALPALDQKPKQASVLLVAVLQFLAPGLRVALV